MKKDLSGFSISDLEQIQEELKNRKKNVLRLDTANGMLNIMIGDDFIGYITESGMCNILNQDEWVDTFNKWVDSEGSVSPDTIEWRDGEYTIIGSIVANTTMNHGGIYCFEECLPVINCEDKNIKRHRNGTPILY